MNLNPYSNGILSDKNAKEATAKAQAVLILILMEYSLIRNVRSCNGQTGSVLILILMEYSLIAASAMMNCRS